MSNVFRDVKEFHTLMGADVDKPFSTETEDLRIKLIQEEFDEFKAEFDTHPIDPVNLTKELADIIYVTVGAAVTWGLPLEEVFKRVHESNLSKLDDDGNPVRREDGKIIKGPNYKPPELGDLFD